VEWLVTTVDYCCGRPLAQAAVQPPPLLAGILKMIAETVGLAFTIVFAAASRRFD